MKIERSQVELVLADATAAPVSRWHVNDTFNRELVAELCRAWLALDAAPVGEVVAVCGSETIGSLETTVKSGRSHRNGTRVHLVATPASGGPME